MEEEDEVEIRFVNHFLSMEEEDEGRDQVC